MAIETLASSRPAVVAKAEPIAAAAAVGECGCGDPSCAPPPAHLAWGPVLLMTAAGGALCLILVKLLGA